MNDRQKVVPSHNLASRNDPPVMFYVIGGVRNALWDDIPELTAVVGRAERGIAAQLYPSIYTSCNPSPPIS
jgi:hypothetical protein